MELYIHIPFCEKKCRYCSFVSFVGKKAEAEDYVSLILQEAEQQKNAFSEPIDTVYIGGGTPSLLPGKALQRMISGLRSLLSMDSVSEFTSEANPGSVTEEWLESALSSGVNRLSLGMQALQPSVLSFLGRLHRYEDVCRTVKAARSAGFKNISLDLLFGIPGQTLADWINTLEAALALSPEHISAYGLIPEENTPLYDDLAHGLCQLPEPELEREMYDELIRILSKEGFHQYEISNFAKDGAKCRHNIGYWTQVPYLGLGIAAVSMRMVHMGKSGMQYVRYTNPDTPEDYSRLICKDSPERCKETIDSTESRFETMMLGLRMNSGVSEERFQLLHGVSLMEVYGKKLVQFEKHDLLIHENGVWKMTRRGFDIQNSILVDFME